MTLVNPFTSVYSDTTGIEQYAAPGALVNIGEELRYDPKVQAIRLAGAEVLQYFDVVECRTKFVGPLDAAMHAGCTPWPTPRANYPGTYLTDIRVGSAWAQAAIDICRGLMIEGKVDGVFLDVLSARLWNNPLNNWSTWTQFEKDAWAQGCAAFVKQLHQIRLQINPKFIIVTNGLWERDDGSFMVEAEMSIDGVCIENHSPFGGNGKIGTFNTVYAGRQFANLGHRRVIAIARTLADAQGWWTVPGITHVVCQTSYVKAAAPLGPFVRNSYYM